MKTIALALFSLTLLAGADQAPAPSFTRSVDTPEHLRAIQTASTEYRPAEGPGPSIWLIGVAHLGTPDYFSAIQKRLDAQTVVLFEGVGLGEAMKQGPAVASKDLGIQKQLAQSLGLTFQLDAIDYRRPSFINSDLPIEGIEKKVAEESATSGPKSVEAVDTVLSAIDGSGSGAEMIAPLIGLLSASAEMRETTRLLFIEILGQAGEMIDLAKGFSPEMKTLFNVLVNERNAIVLRDTRAQLARLKPEQSLAIFYGAAHMSDIAQHLRDDLHYIPASAQWDTAFAADPAKSSIPMDQLRLMLNMAKSQLHPPAPTPPKPAP